MRRVFMTVAMVVSLALLVTALWVWQSAPAFTAGMSAQEIETWAVRSAAVCLAALAQVVVLTFVIQSIYGRDTFGDILNGAAGLLCVLSMVSAIALGLAGR